MAVFSGAVDPTIKRLWNRINLALIFHCLPSMVGNEANIDIEAARIILEAKEELKKKPEGDDR